MFGQSSCWAGTFNSVPDLRWGIPGVSVAHVWPMGPGAGSEMGPQCLLSPYMTIKTLGAWIVKLVSGVGTSASPHPRDVGSIPTAPFGGNRLGPLGLTPWRETLPTM